MQVGFHDEELISSESAFQTCLRNNESLLSRFLNQPTFEAACSRWERQVIRWVRQLEDKIRLENQGDYDTLRMFCLDRLIQLCKYAEGLRYRNPDCIIDVLSWNNRWEPVILCQAYFLSPRSHLLDVIVGPYWEKDVFPFVRRFKYGAHFEKVHLERFIDDLLLCHRILDETTYEERSVPCPYDGRAPVIVWILSRLRSYLSLKEPDLLKGSREVERLSSSDWQAASRPGTLQRPEIWNEIENRAPKMRDQYQDMSMDEEKKNKGSISLRDLIVVTSIVDGVLQGEEMQNIAAQCGISDKKIAEIRRIAFKKIIDEMKKSERTMREWDDHEIVELLISVFAGWNDDLRRRMMEIYKAKPKKGK